MHAMWSETKATAGQWPAAPLRAGFASPIPNETLIRLAGRQRPDGAAASHSIETAHGLKKSGPRHGAGVTRYAHLNSFFVISANSPSMSMVNFSCCVCSAPKSCAPGVTPGMTAQPMRVAVLTEAGAHARL